MDRFIGIDLGAETLKLVELQREAGELKWTRSLLLEHHKEPAKTLTHALAQWDWAELTGAASCGRLARSVRLPRIPEKQARAQGFRFLHDDAPATVVSIGGHGFSVLELRGEDVEIFRENSRCSQGTGNFLRQLVERFGLDVEAASALCQDVNDPAPLSGRCPVILKTDMTHLANLGQSHERILAGLYDAVAENVQVLLKPKLAPKRLFVSGGVSRSLRIRRHFERFAQRHELEVLPYDEDQALFIDALGCALFAAQEGACELPALEAIPAPQAQEHLDTYAGLKSALGQVKRIAPTPMPKATDRPEARLVLGLDIGSTGSKMVAIDALDGELLWQAYTSTQGAPVDAAQRLIHDFEASPWAPRDVVRIGATGSGREIVGSLLHTCYGAERVFVLNEIAAHAEGALHYDPRVDTIFEIGGQDAKYIRLAEGRVVDAAMNEACSAGTGSFIEEQGLRFSNVEDVVQMGQIALQAPEVVSLGQHCSVFMAEIIDEAAAAGVDQATIIAGIYDSIIQNYLNRVKGSRSVGQVIFCQGMPFSSDALAAAVAKRTGSQVIVPPNPGTIGALGIARLTRRERPLSLEDMSPLTLARFLSAEVIAKDHFICKSTKGCGGAGNKCRIERLRTRVEGKEQRFTWGGGCSLYDKGTGKRKLPDGAPDPFRQREELVSALLANLPKNPLAPVVALTDEFVLKSLFPFFATYIARLGGRLEVMRGASQKTLKRGIEEANVPFCAPMQIYHGVVSAMAEGAPDFLFMPMILSAPPLQEESRSVLCPMVQGSADLNRWDLGALPQGTQILSPVFEIHHEGLRSQAFMDGCQALAHELGARAWEEAFEAALAAQNQFEDQCFDLGREALRFCERESYTPVVVLGRPYTIYNNVLNSNVPTILREQGAVAIPVDCYPVEAEVPVIEDIFWGFGQRNLRAAHQIRRSPSTYSLWTSNYACGPDSFNLHLFHFLMEGKPWAVIETDGHSGDAGTRTRVEAFLHCVHEDQRAQQNKESAPQPQQHVAELGELGDDSVDLESIQQRQERVLIPRMGPGAEALAAVLQGVGIDALALPEPTYDSLEIGRRYTSGKECVPLVITLGSLLHFLEQHPDPEQRYVFFMPKGRGPCRFGVYHMVHKIVLKRLGLEDRVRVWAPSDNGYFDGIPAGISALVLVAVMVADILYEAHNDVRPVEAHAGATAAIFKRYSAELAALMKRAGAGDLSIGYALKEVATGRFFGCADLLRRAGREFAAEKRDVEVPTALMVGEIYVRCDPFANDNVIERLQRRGIRVRLAPFHEWLDYQEFINNQVGIEHDLASWFSAKVQAFVQVRTYNIMGRLLGWPEAPRAGDAVKAAAHYVRYQLEGEAALTLGGGLLEWQEGHIDGVLSVAPLECMPSKIAEAQFFHAAEREGLYSMTLSLNGDPVDPDTLDNFTFEIRSRFKKRQRLKRHVQRLSTRQRINNVAAELRQGFPKLLPKRLTPFKRRLFSLKGAAQSKPGPDLYSPDALSET